jgi:hypothetical protein
MGRRLLPLFLVVPAFASAQGVFDMGALTNTMAQGAIVKSERERSIRSGHGDPLAGRRRKVRPNPAVLLYQPSLAARKRNMEGFLAQFAAVDPAAMRALREEHAKSDLIVQGRKVMRAKLGLNPDNIADATALYLVTAWHGAKGDDKGTKAEYRAVAAQLGRYVAADPSMARVSNAVKQQTAESMILNALIVDATVTNAMKTPGKLPGVKSAVAQGARKTFGFDLTALRLGTNGLY